MERENASSSAVGATVVLQPRLGAASMEVPRCRVISQSGSGNWGVGGGCDGNGIAEAAMDLASPEARCG